MLKSFFLILFLLSVNIFADEIQRIQKVLLDIEKLRQNYDRSQEELSFCSVKLTDEKQKNEILLQEIEALENKIVYLNNQIKSIKKFDNKDTIKYSVAKVISNNCSKNQIEIENKFPKLQIRKEFLKSHKQDKSAYTYRLINSAPIYDAIDGDEIELWESQTSFTSNYKSGEWIKITGYFINRVWQKAQRELWVKAQNTKQR